MLDFEQVILEGRVIEELDQPLLDHMSSHKLVFRDGAKLQHGTIVGNLVLVHILIRTLLALDASSQRERRHPLESAVVLVLIEEAVKEQKIGDRAMDDGGDFRAAA
jgi:hypothetical protein